MNSAGLKSRLDGTEKAKSIQVNATVAQMVEQLIRNKVVFPDKPTPPHDPINAVSATSLVGLSRLRVCRLPECDNTFIPRAPNHQYCCKEHATIGCNRNRQAWLQKHPGYNAEHYAKWHKAHKGTPTCVICGNEIHSKPARAYCSDECRRAARGLRQEKTCVTCGKTFRKHYGGKYCSEKCRHARSRRMANAAHKAHRQRYPMRFKVRYLTMAAINRGDLVRQPCVICGSTDHIEAHHPFYRIDQCLNVIWLCRKHHHWIHRTREYLQPTMTWLPDIPQFANNSFPVRTRRML